MRIISILTLTLGILVLSGCKQSYISKGDEAYNNLAFKKAIKNYEKALGKKEDSKLHAKIASAYERMNNSAKAEEHYEIALKDENADDKIHFNYAKSLVFNGKQDEAITEINLYLQKHPGDEYIKEWVSKQTKIGEFDEFEPDRINMELLPISGFSGTFSACPNKDIVYFIGEKEAETGAIVNPWNGKAFLDVFQIQKGVGNSWSEPKPIKGDMNSILHDGPITLDSSGQTAYVTKSAVKDNNKRKLDDEQYNQLIIAEYKKNISGNWTFSKDLSFNQAKSSTMHPALTYDAKFLFFSSDREGGKGGNDLYMVELDGNTNTWGEAQNLGPNINTPGNEVFPFAYVKDTLFFSSNGHGGMGGLDVFVSTFDGSVWSHPRNLKAPINTNFDDFSFYREKNGLAGYLSSNRTGNDKIYSWGVHDPVFLLVGKVIDNVNDPVPYANVVLRRGNIVLDSVITDPSGEFSMPLEWKKDYEVNGSKITLKTNTVNVSTLGKTNSDTINVELILESPEFSVNGIVINKNSKARIPNVKVELLNSVDARLNEVQSNANGEFKFRLNSNEDYSIYGSLKNNFTRKVEVSTMGLKESKTFEVVLELEELKEDVTVTLNNIYYDYNKWNIRADAVGDLDNLLRFMKDNPGARIELRSHTDSRGTSDYNLGLSDKRAKSAMNYLISRGIDAARMEYKGYGENLLKNECKDGVDCSEEKHQDNRRTEFKVLYLDK